MPDRDDNDSDEYELDPYANLRLRDLRRASLPSGFHEAVFRDNGGGIWTFARQIGHPRGVVATSTAFWANRPVRLTPRDERTQPPMRPGEGLVIRDEHAYTMSIPHDVSTWLATCWWTTNTDAQRRGDLDIIARDIAATVRQETLDTNVEVVFLGGPARVARTCMLVGQAAGRRGMDDWWTSALYQAVMPDLFPNLNDEISALRPRT